MGGDIFNVHAHMSHHMPHTILPTTSTPSHNTIITAGGSRLLTHVHMQLEPRLDVSHACAYDLPSLPPSPHEEATGYGSTCMGVPATPLVRTPMLVHHHLTSHHTLLQLRGRYHAHMLHCTSGVCTCTSTHVRYMYIPQHSLHQLP